MPFHNGVFYPFPGDTQQGTRSSAGIPSLLNSPLSQPPSSPSAGMTPPGGLPAFRFRGRRESVDWRRIGAVDVDRVVSELDVDALQEHIGAVTFCSLEGERCQRCQSPVDPALVKLLRLAQLTVEWLLHCQSFLSLGLREAEGRLAAAGGDREQLLAQQSRLEEKVKALTAELKQRKKFIRTQQSLLGPKFIGSHKCMHCEKAFINSSFLQNHMQRRHPDEYDMQLRSDSDKKSVVESLKVEISSLKEELSQQQQALLAKAAREKEQESLHKDLLRELDRFKAEEMARMERKIEDSRDGMCREIRNLQSRIEADQNQRWRETAASPVPRQPERDLDNYKEMQAQAIQKLEHELKKQDKKWESRLQEIKAQHESEKNQWLTDLSGMQASVSEQQERSHRMKDELRRKLQEKDRTIVAQREQIKSISSHPPKVVEVPAPEPKPKRVAMEQPPSVAKLDPIQELSDEEKESSVSQREPPERKPAPERKAKVEVAASALRGNPDIKRHLRPGVEQAYMETLERLGVRPDQSGLGSREFSALMAKALSQRESSARDIPDYWRHRENAVHKLEQMLRERRRGSDPAPQQRGGVARPPGPSAEVAQIRPRSSSLPSRVTQVVSGPPAKHAKTPQPAPRTKTSNQPWTSTPNPKSTAKTSVVRTPPFSSDEESEQEETEEEEEEEPKPIRATPLQTRAGKASPAMTRRTPAQNHFRAPGGGASQTPVRAIDSDDEDDDDDDWTDGSVIQEISTKRLQGYTDQNGNVGQKNVIKKNSVTELTGKLATQIAERSVKKPAGGVSILPPRKDAVQELTYTDSAESDWVVSSLEEGNVKSAPKAKQGSGPLRKSVDTPSTSVWGTSTGRKSGMTEAGTGSTLKSALSLSDFSDSEDI